ncbi:MAG: TSUP family transporter, partial [Bacteroidota bacterium]
TTATGYTKLMNFTSNIVSCLLFALGGHVLPLAGAVMAVGQILGARLGSGMVVRRGARFIRPVFVSMVILTTLKLMYDRFF